MMECCVVMEKNEVHLHMLHRNLTEIITFKEKGGKEAEVGIGMHLGIEKELMHTTPWTAVLDSHSG